MTRKIFTVIFFLSGLLYLWYLHDKRLSLGDEGIMLLAAERVLNGEVIYKDFFDFITPGAVFTTSLFFKIFGVSYYTVELLSFLLAFLIVFLTYLVSRQVIRNFILAFIPALLFLISGPSSVALVGRHYWFSIIIVLITLYLMLKNKSSIFTGLLIGIGFIFSQAIGVFLFFGVLAFFVIEGCRFRTEDRFRFILRQGVLLICGFSLPVLLLLGFLYKVDALHHFWYQIGPFSVNNYLAVNYISPSVEFLFFWLIFAFSAFMFRTRTLLLLGVVSLFISLSSFYQFGMLQFLYLSAPFFIFTVKVLEESVRRRVRVAIISVRWFFSVLLTVLMTSFLLYFFFLGSFFLSRYSKSSFKRLQTPRGNIWLYEPNWQREAWVFDLLAKDYIKDKKLVFLPYSPHIYFLSGRVNPLRYQFIFPGFNSLKMHEEAVRDLEGYNPELVHFSLQEMSFPYDFDNPVFNYITENYDLLINKKITSDERINALFIRKDLKGSGLEVQLKSRWIDQQ